MMVAKEPLLERYAALQDKISEACRISSRKREDVLLVAISKKHLAEEIAVIKSLGQLDFGENYIQEYEKKQAIFENAGIQLEWHFTGHLQRRKASKAAGKFKLIHTLDSRELAESLERQLKISAKIQPVLLEINIGNEPQKTGLKPVEALFLMEYIKINCSHLRLEGLMCIPPILDAGSHSKKWFEKLAYLRDELSARSGMTLSQLSMGMTGDFEAAISAGATIIRIGTGIFGSRQ